VKPFRPLPRSGERGWVKVKNRYVRPRAIFAEQVVAVWVGGKVMEFPGQAWDVEMPLGPGPKVQIQVKCSGERAPFDPDNQMKEKWGLYP
jgi:hypothetical protein